MYWIIYFKIYEIYGIEKTTNEFTFELPKSQLPNKTGQVERKWELGGEEDKLCINI